ncbi:MAG: 4-deoxy-4-formamido-L-arabinose-phosphoundecaprenol deformylase [Synergistaceae bacterium]|nr:4-deoxy-4-formamido-L-arabinose-phosphoundecaprenol deformylase [Synergistaceae bacterium]
MVIKTDVDTLKGYREGVPRLLEIFRARKMRASLFFSFGPDNSGKAIRRVFKKGFIQKMRRTKAPSTYGLRTMLYGTLLPAPKIVQSEPSVFIRAIHEGHDCGIHCWDHVDWHDNLHNMEEHEIRAAFGKAMELFEHHAGRPAKSCAAPGWQATPASLSVQDELGFEYCSDARGPGGPFRPRMEGREFKTLQIPTTLPTLDELMGTIPAERINDRYMELIRPGLNVHTIHAEMEGQSQSALFEDLLERCAKSGATFRTLDDVALETTVSGTEIPVCEVKPGEIPGRWGTVAVQSCEA